MYGKRLFEEGEFRGHISALPIILDMEHQIPATLILAIEQSTISDINHGLSKERMELNNVFGNTARITWDWFGNKISGSGLLHTLYKA
jgi:hypothetical protein